MRGHQGAMMASIALSSHFLPTVKCSDCNAEIEISVMGEHICAQGIRSCMLIATMNMSDGFPVHAQPKLKLQTLGHPFNPSIPKTAPPSRKPLNQPLSKVDTASAGKQRRTMISGVLLIQPAE